MKVSVLYQSTIKSLKIIYKRTIASIAFIPAVVALFFLLLSFIMVQFDFSEAGKDIKKNAHWLTLKDAETARSIISTITGGIISLTVFSFSMVMILLNQAASQMSNRILDKLIGNRFQQSILGFYIGTIVYALFLLSTIRDINSGIYVPAISTYLLIAFTVIDIFLFIYFLHYVTQSVKYETIIHQIFKVTQKSLEKSCFLKSSVNPNLKKDVGLILTSYKSGIYQGFSKDGLLSICEREDLVISFLYPAGTFILENRPLMRIINKSILSEELVNELHSMINIHRGQDIDENYYYGFRQLMEVAVKALSPGINDPGTAILSLQALGHLLSFRLQNFPINYLEDKNDVIRILIKQRFFSEVMEDCVYPIWDYGKEDRLLVKEIKHVLLQLKEIEQHPLINNLLELANRAASDREHWEFEK